MRSRSHDALSLLAARGWGKQHNEYAAGATEQARLDCDWP